ncbi:MAG: sugar phosphate isomerase/epimerase family protein [Candidatus Bathyarchaeia archaeon]
MVSLFVAVRDGILTWSGFQDVFSGLDALGLKSLELAISKKREGLEGTESLSALGLELSSEGIEDLKETFKRKGISVCAILLDNDFSKEDLNSEVKYITEACTIAQELGVKVARINAVMKEIPGASILDYHRRTVKGVKACLRKAEDLGISLAVENHGLIANNFGFLLRLFKEIGSELFGLTLDTGNFYWYGYPLEEIYDIVYGFAPFVKHTHIKNGSVPADRRDRRRKPRDMTMAPLYEGDIDMKIVVETLKDAGYDHDLTIEDESLGRFSIEDRKAILAKDVDYMRGLLP